MLPLWRPHPPWHQWQRHRASLFRRRRPDHLLPHDALLRLSRPARCSRYTPTTNQKPSLTSQLYAVLDQSGSKDKRDSILVLSRGTAIILLVLYVLYLFFQLRTHSNLFDPESHMAGVDDETTQTPDAEEEEEEEEHPVMGPIAALGVLVVVTVLVAICADYLVGSIDEIVESTNISKAFIGLILIPIVGNAAEHVTAVVVAIRNKMDLAMGVAIGSSIQIALGVTPFLVIVGWIMDKDMTLRFETCKPHTSCIPNSVTNYLVQTVSFAVSVLVVTYTVQDGKSNYLEGAMLIGLYTIIAVAFYATPGDAMDGAKALFVGN